MQLHLFYAVTSLCPALKAGDCKPPPASVVPGTHPSWEGRVRL